LKEAIWHSAEAFLLAFSDATERRTGLRRELYPEQRAAVIHNDGPLAIIAGPGTGKTETLVLRALRLLLVDGLPPQSIVLTTFTEKAARELTDRMARYLQFLSDAVEFAGKDKPDLSQVWTGTLHSLALRLLREYSPANEGLRLLDELGAHFLFLKTLRASDLTSIMGDTLYFCLAGKKAETWTNRLKRAKVIREFLARLVEDDIDLNKFWTTPSSIFEPARDRLQELFEAYHEAIGPGTVDLTGLQKTFLDFLRSRCARDFLQGRSDRALPGIRQVIVDEYQDTNSIQEAIYFALAGASSNLVVVGDDDQALYRFRGASVELLLQFEERCRSGLGQEPRKIYLSENRRSHSSIVKQLNRYLKSTSSIAEFHVVRDKQKPPLKVKAGVTGAHPGAAVIVRVSERQLANVVADTIQDLYSGGYVTDLRQVALLAPTTKKTSAIGEYEAAFSLKGIPTYNPRAKQLSDDPAIGLVLGSLLEILDPEGEIERLGGEVILKAAQKPRSLFSDHRSDALGRYVTSTRDKLHSRGTGKTPPQSLLEIIYRCFAYDPLLTELAKTGGARDAIAAWRLGRFTRLLRAFEEVHAPNGLPLVKEREKEFWTRRNRVAPERPRGPSPHFVDRFCRDFLATLAYEGLNDPVDGTQNLPTGAVPILTIHQAKGLEFPIVFVCGFKESFGAGSEHHQEDLLLPFRSRPVARGASAIHRGHHDTIRQFFVAYSRAQWLMALCVTEQAWESTNEQVYPHLPGDFKKALVRL
jgi:DNA helicase-2/ATP-dependent DNA helicase PcrA